MDRAKENLFNLLSAEYVSGQRWLDLFGGTGQVGIEALSRGAAQVTFIDNSRHAISTIKENLAHTKLEDRATVRFGDSLAYLATTDSQFDVIFIAPPQYQGMWVTALTAVAARQAKLLAPDGVIVVQIDPKEYKPFAHSSLILDRQKIYGSTMLCFYTVIEGEVAIEN